MNLEHVSVLRGLGFTQIQAKTYLTLLGSGKVVAGGIAKKARIHRRNTYDALEQLLQKGLVSYTIINNRKYWCAVNPKKMISLIREQETSLSNVIPELIAQFKESKSKRTVEVFEGLGGMKTFFDDMIKTKKDITMLFATGKAYVYIPHYMKKWNKELNSNKISVRALLNPGISRKPYEDYKYGSIRVLPLDLYSPTQLFIYGNKSCIAFWSENPLAVLITNENISMGFRKYFDFLWKLGKP